MKRFLFFVTSLCLVLPAGAQQGEEPEYNPPARGAPSGRVGGGTRGLRVLPLAALAPDHTGLTISAQPALYYFLPASSGVRVAVRLAGDPNAQPLLEKDFAPPAKSGIQRLELKALGVTLAPGVEYRWTVSDARTSSTGMIRRIDPSQDLARKLNGVPTGRSRYTLLAREGVWYDALDEVSRAADGASPIAGRHRAALLEQIGLKDIAQHERQLYQ
ncbi:MAG: hypothetical protein QOD26_1742 [Betaproteobacteria bacterium]|jgi:hypothetical protein|nr:hypothetical protein [Betaproteobacteria bacterium]